MIRNNIISLSVTTGLLLLAYLILGCNERKTTDKRVSSLSSLTNPDNWLLSERADTFFHYSIPVDVKEGRQFVYVVNATCSACIVKALDCFDAYLATKNADSFYFLSKEKDIEIFNYYFRIQYGNLPRCFTLEDGNALKDGIYYIYDKQVRSYSPWE